VLKARPPATWHKVRLGGDEKKAPVIQHKKLREHEMI
jgi:hypothetical protein